MKILLIEDDHMIGSSLSKSLNERAFTINWCTSAQSGKLAIESESYALILLDLGLPDFSGLELLKEIRKNKIKTPVLIITAKDSIDDRVAGLNAGADDYLVKPFALIELEARMKALLRRVSGKADSELSNAELTLNTETKTLINGVNSFVLPAREYALIHALLETPGKVWSKAELEERIYGWNEEIESNAIEFHIHQLRKKIGSDAIINIRGLGYRVKK